MKILFYFLILISVALSSCKKEEKSSINFELKNELSEIYFRDQFIRNITDKTPKDSLIWFAEKINLNPDYFLKNYKSANVQLDSENQKKIEKIIKKYGYPGKSLVGIPENMATWIVIQHSSTAMIEKYLPLLRNAAQNNELPKTALALTEDRILMYQGKEQLYGSQSISFLGKNGKEQFIIWPIKNPEKVNELRKKIGFTQTVEEYAKDLFGDDFQYKIYTLDEVKKLQNQ